MKPTPEQIKQMVRECGLTYTLTDAKRFEAFFTRAYELGRKDRGESDAAIRNNTGE